MVVMVVGIGFGSLLIGTVAERFVAPGVRAEAQEIEQGGKATETDVLREVRALGERLAASRRPSTGAVDDSNRSRRRRAHG